MSRTVRTVGSRRNTSWTQRRCTAASRWRSNWKYIAAGASAATETRIHWATWPTSSCQNAGLLAGHLADVGERVVEPEDRPVVDRQELVELRRQVDRHAEPDHADDDGADQHGDLGGLAGHAVDERPDPAAPLDALERPMLAGPSPLASGWQQRAPGTGRSAGTGGSRGHVATSEGDHRDGDDARDDPRPRHARSAPPKNSAHAPKQQADGEPAEDDDRPRQVRQQLARRRPDLDLTQAAHVERVQPQASSAGTAVSPSAGMASTLMTSSAHPFPFGMARSGREGVACGVEARVDAPRREVLVDPPSRGRAVTGIRV